MPTGQPLNLSSNLTANKKNFPPAVYFLKENYFCSFAVTQTQVT
jgi:hypothetical protein